MPKVRISSGVEGLDQILGGGYIKGRSMLVTGGPGTGKSILSWHFIFDSVAKGEGAILLSLDESSNTIIEDMKSFGWDPQMAIDDGKLTIITGTLRLVPTEAGYDYLIAFENPLFREKPFTVPRLADLVMQKATEMGASRIAIDGISPLLEFAGNRFDVRQMVYSFIRELMTHEATVLLTHELRTLSGARNDEMPYFISDGVIRLDTLFTAGDYIRTIRIVKLRGTGHVMKPVMFRIQDEGIVVFPEARVHE